MTQPTRICFAEWTLHRATGELERAGKRVRLQDLPCQILDELLLHPGDVVTREHLIARLWPRTVVDYESNLNSSVRRLRAVLRDDADAPRYIETVPRKGYRYIGARPRFDEDGPSVPPVARPDVVRARSAKRSAVLGSLLIAAVGVTAGTFWAAANRSAGEASRPPAVVAPATRLRLAVLPFTNLSPDPANAFFTDGMHEETLNAIASRAPYLEVISRTTMTTYRSTPRTVREIARELGVTHVLEGSVRRNDRQVRLTLTLIDAQDDVHIWSQNFDAPLAEALVLQSRIADEVGSRLATKLSGNIGELPRPANPAAYDLYLKARATRRTVGASRSAREQLQAEELLSRAIEMDRGFAAAHLERARVRLNKLTTSHDTSAANLRALQADLGAAREQMGDSPPLLITEALYADLVDFDSNRASHLLEVARAMNPHSSEVHLALGRHLSSSGNADAALPHFARAIALDPVNPIVLSDWAAMLKMARRAGESLRVSREFDSLHPGQITYGWRLFGFTGQLARFEREVAEAAQSSDASTMLPAQFDLLLFSGRLAELAELLEHSRLETISQADTGGFAIPALGRKPVAELHGWVKLLQKDTKAAARDGRTVLSFVAREPSTRWNAWYLQMLAAEGALFTGDRHDAVVKARAALESAPRGVHVGIQRYSRALAARVFAWAGATDEAVALLEQMSTTFPMAGPAEITADPLYSAPLAGVARFAALVAKLDAELAANQPLRDADFVSARPEQENR